MAELIRSYDWANSALGSPATWPSCLRSSLEMILPAHAQIVMFWGPDFIALYNDAYAPTIGDRHPQAFGQPARENWDELWYDLGPLLLSVFETGKTVSAKDRPFYMERHGYPETAYFDISYSAIRDEKGIVRGVLCLVEETTQRVNAQAALRESESRLAAIFSQASGGIAQCDLEGRFKLVNQRYCEIVSYSEEELMTMRMQDITHPDDLAENQSFFSRLVSDGTNFIIEKRYVRKDGSHVWVSNSVGLIRDEQGVPRQTLALVIDISQRRRAEQVERRLAAIIASSEDAILSLDLDTRITSWNSGAERLYGYTADEVIGQMVTLLVPRERSDEETNIIASIRQGQRVAPYDTQRLRKDGSLVHVSLTVSPIVDEHGHVIGASKIARDITDRKHAEQLQRVIVQEMQHRVKNIFATVQAIARQTFNGTTDVANALQAFDGRVLAMTQAHDLLHSGTWDGADLCSIVDQAAAPYARDRFTVTGTSVRLSPRASLALSLGLHELATNAAKYGALAAPGGQVHIGWSVTKGVDPVLHLRWKETGGPAVTPPTRKGFGSKLIQSLLATQLGGDVAVSYPADGLECIVVAPLETAWES